MVALVAGRLPRDTQQRIEDARTTLKGSAPKGFEWVERLSRVHQRQFAVELYSALATFNISEDPNELVNLLEAWEATAEMDVAPEVAAQMRAAKDYREWKP